MLRFDVRWVIVLVGMGTVGVPANGQDPRGPGIPAPPTGLAVRSLDDLVRLDPAALELLYRQSPPAPIPNGKVVGRPVVMPGSVAAVPASRAGRLVWQGKVFDPAAGIAENRFFGVRAIKGELYYAESWLDGGPALILDYGRTSKVYGRYRDELREVAPGLVLGLMYDRRGPVPKRTRFFALDYGSASH
ncbi:hypothetical protein [Tautonia plasticadhaerens]|uniref:Uncharacterized protein n=1 Tax=Tautonia plasticadhaerens TaxID=2527974 RepID=A0A518GUW3_9BACT|nr:hypothetical protein [Tautonia plasticadhaerens]QDV32374.1 hypothetical protein ElP_02030 [Tautonia plasticadhaerens]